MKNLVKGLVFLKPGVVLLLAISSLGFSQDFGIALEFDGSDDFVFVGNDTSLYVDQFTLTAWIHPYSYSEPLPYEARMEIFEKADEYWMNISTTDRGTRDIGEVRVGGKFEGQWYYLDSEYVVPLNQWTHVACTYDFDSLKLYINGQYETAREIAENHTNQLDSLNMLALGCKCIKSPLDSIEAQFHGMMDEISIWDAALNVADIQELKNKGIPATHTSIDRLKAYYKFDEDRIGLNDGTTYDELGLNHGDNYGAYWVVNELSIVASRSASAQQHLLKQNYPNPFNGVTNIPFTLSQPGNVRVTIYDISGRVVKEIVSAPFSEGDHVVQWNASGLSSGSYIYEIKVGDSSQMRKCMLAF